MSDYNDGLPSAPPGSALARIDTALGWLVALSASGTLQPRLTFGLALLAALQLAMSAIVVLKPALLGPRLGVW